MNGVYHCQIETGEKYCVDYKGSFKGNYFQSVKKLTSFSLYLFFPIMMVLRYLMIYIFDRSLGYCPESIC